MQTSCWRSLVAALAGALALAACGAPHQDRVRSAEPDRPSAEVQGVSPAPEQIGPSGTGGSGVVGQDRTLPGNQFQAPETRPTPPAPSH